MKTFFAEIRQKTEKLNEKERNNKAVCEAHLNSVKNLLAEKVKELFGIEYHYDIHDIAENAETETISEEDGKTKDLRSQVDSVCASLDDTLNTIFMHREENAYKVVRRINDLNRLVQKLVRMRDGR